MPCSRKFLVFTGCAVLACSGLGAGAADKKDKDKSKTDSATPAKGDKKADDKKKDTDGDKPTSKLVIPLPKGQDSKGVVIPYTDKSGKKSMVFKIGLGTRVDDSHVKMSNVVIETYDDKGAQEMTIALPSSVLDMDAHLLSGDQSVTIDRSDFKITGKNMEFNTETRRGWIKGNVKMIIYDLSGESKADTPKTPGEDSESQKPKGS
jgi:hypothetical protein